MILVLDNGVVQHVFADDQLIAPTDFPGLVIVYYEGQATVRQPDPRTFATQLTDAKTAKLSDVDAWYTAKIATGVIVEVNGAPITLAATAEDQSRLTSLGAMQHLAQSLGQLQLTDETGVSDANNIWQTMTVQQLFGALLDYGAQLLALAKQFYVYREQIESAATVEAVNAITIE